MSMLQEKKLESSGQHNSNIPSQIGKQQIKILSIVVITADNKNDPGI
jgi:hypothetical protein